MFEIKKKRSSFSERGRALLSFHPSRVHSTRSPDSATSFPDVRHRSEQQWDHRGYALICVTRRLYVVASLSQRRQSAMNVGPNFLPPALKLRLQFINNRNHLQRPAVRQCDRRFFGPPLAEESNRRDSPLVSPGIVRLTCARADPNRPKRQRRPAASNDPLPSRSDGSVARCRLGRSSVAPSSCSIADVPAAPAIATGRFLALVFIAASC